MNVHDETLRVERLTVRRGVTERTIRAGDVTGVMWAPETATDPTPLILLDDGMRGRAEGLARRYGLHVLVLDAPRGGPAAVVRGWRRALDAVPQLPGIDEGRPVGYLGEGRAVEVGLRLAAADSRIGALAIGPVSASPATTAGAPEVRVPVRLVLAWDDPEAPRTDGLALFDAIGTRRKSLHAFPGTSRDVPAAEADESAWFLARHLLGP